VNPLSEYEVVLARLQIQATDHVLLVPLGEKILAHWSRGRTLATYPFSFSKRPPSCEQDSLGTPWGLHEVAQKVGDGELPGTVFRGRLSTGKHWQAFAETDREGSLVTTRILRLSGLEPGLNAGPGVDSWERYIYLHGTNHPEEFPRNRSAGCLLLRDDDLLELYERLPLGSHVFILPQPDQSTRAREAG